MKLTTILILAGCLQVSARTSAQTVTLSVKNTSLEKVFFEIKKQTGYSFVYNDRFIQNSKPVTVDAQRESLNSVLVKCFWDQPFTYEILDKTIIIKDINNINLKEEPLPKPASFDVAGRIYNVQSEPLSGADIKVKSTGKGTISDEHGRFRLTNLNSTDELIISFIGYKTQTVKIGVQTSLTIILESSTNKLDEVKVQAYGVTNDRIRTGNIATVRAEEIERRPAMNVLTALQGLVPGLEVTQQSGYASAPFKVELRGRKLLNVNASPDPLYVIDGVPLTVLEPAGGNASGGLGFLQNGFIGPAVGQSPLFSLNPSDIESISILKDADATAIYGSRGGNGVILITTKKGKSEKTAFEINVYQGQMVVPRFYDMMSTKEYVTMRREALKNDNLTPTASNAPDLILWDTSKYTDWQKYLWGNTGKTTDVQLSLSSGSKQTTFRVGAAYHHETGVTTVSGSNQRASLQFNLSHKSLNQRLSLSFSNLYTFTKINEIAWNRSLVLLPPNAPDVFDANGKLNFSGYQPTNLFQFGSILQPYTSNTGFLNTQLNMQYELTKGLSFLSSLGYSTNKISQNAIVPIVSQNPLLNPTGSASFGNNSANRWIIEPQLKYTSVLEKVRMEFLLGGTMQHVEQDGNYIIGNGYVNDNLLYSISNAPTKNASDVTGTYKYQAFFTRINLNYSNKYILNLSGRRDGSSRFGPGKQFGNFGAIGIAYLISEETWFRERMKFFSFAKLRASYGITGSDNIGDYGYITRWSGNTSNIDPYQGAAAYTPTQHANPNLQWQENKKLEIGLNVGVFDDKISLDFSWYRDRCGNQLVDYSLPNYTGFSFVTSNRDALVQNSGFEIQLRTAIIDKSKIKLQANFNLGVNRNKLISFPNIEYSPYNGQFFVGQPLRLARLLNFTGVDPQTGRYTFEDKNKDGSIDDRSAITGDLYLYDLNSKYSGGIGFDLSYGAFELNLFANFNKLSLLRSAIYNSSLIPGALGLGNQSTQIVERWQKPGDVAQFARYSTRRELTDAQFLNSNGLFSNGSFMRLSNVAMTFNMPSAVCKRLKISNFQLYLKGSNLFLWTKYNGVDPDTPAFGVLPPLRNIVAGLKINL